MTYGIELIEKNKLEKHIRKLLKEVDASIHKPGMQTK